MGNLQRKLLAILNSRLHHNAKDEVAVAMNEQHKITVIRLAKLIKNLLEKVNLKSHITTHVLDTSMGIPSKQIPIILKGFLHNQWKPISVGVTNKDGRVLDILPPARFLTPGVYTLVFDTETYYKDNNQKGFYPRVSIQFKVIDRTHYHVPLLINPFGYSTYKGS